MQLIQDINDSVDISSMRNSRTDSYIKTILMTCKEALVYVGVFSLFVNILMLTVPLYMLQLFDRVLASRSFDTLLYLTLIAIIALSAYALLEYCRARILLQVSQWLDGVLSPAALTQSADELLQGRRYGGQALRDIGSMRHFLSSPAMFALFDSPWVPIYLCVIFMLHPLMGWISLGGAIILFFLAFINEVVTAPPLAEANNKQLDAQQHTDATLRNVEVIQAMGMMPALVAKWVGKNAEVIHLQIIASDRSSIILSFSKFIRLLVQITLLGFGAYLVVNNELTSGAMMAGSILMSRALSPVEQSIGAWKQMVGARQAYHRLEKHFEHQAKRTAGITLPAPLGQLDLSNVSYYSPTTRKAILSNITLSVAPGEMIALIGPSAAGKTTLARLIMGVWPASTGSVRLDSADVFTWDRVEFGKHVGYLPQDVELFSGTIKDNIARMGDADDAAVILAAKMAGVHELILKLPSGYDTKINTAEFNLSGGQRQRIALARALYNTPRLIVLDEPNSNLDVEGEEALLQALLELKRLGSTIVIVAHRPSIVKFVDKIAVLQNGQLQYSGPRDEVLAKVQQGQSGPLLGDRNARK